MEARIKQLEGDIAKFSALADERHDLLSAERRENDELRRQQSQLSGRIEWLRARLSEVEKERDRFSELADKRHDDLCEARRQRDALAANHEVYTREAVRHAIENLDHKGEV